MSPRKDETRVCGNISMYIYLSNSSVELVDKLILFNSSIMSSIIHLLLKIVSYLLCQITSFVH